MSSQQRKLFSATYWQFAFHLSASLCFSLLAFIPNNVLICKAPFPLLHQQLGDMENRYASLVQTFAWRACSGLFADQTINSSFSQLLLPRILLCTWQGVFSMCSFFQVVVIIRANVGVVWKFFEPTCFIWQSRVGKKPNFYSPQILLDNVIRILSSFTAGSFISWSSHNRQIQSQLLKFGSLQGSVSATGLFIIIFLYTDSFPALWSVAFWSPWLFWTTFVSIVLLYLFL